MLNEGHYEAPDHKLYCSYYLIEGVKIEINQAIF